MGKAYIGETVLSQEEQIINNAPTKVLTLNEDDEITVSEIGNVRGVESVTGYAVDNTDPRNPLINKVSDIGDLPLIFCPKNEAGNFFLGYITDEYRTLDLTQFVPEGLEFVPDRTRGILKAGNDIYLKTVTNNGVNNGQNVLGLLRLINLKTEKNILKVDGSQYVGFPEVLKDASNYPYNMHSEAVIDDFIYLVTRTEPTNPTNPTQVFKVNKNDISQYEFVSLPTTTGFLGHVGEIQAYKDQLFMLSRPSQSAGGYIISIDKDLYNPTIYLGPFGNTTSQQRIAGSSPFLIYQDKFYIPTFYGSGTPAGYLGNNIGMLVYDVNKKTLLASRTDITIDTDGTTAATMTPHWMSIFDGKLFLHTATGSGNANKRLVRIDLNPSNYLNLDGSIEVGSNVASIDIPYLITNNNTISEEGWIYLNPEGGSFDRPLKRYWHKDFSIQETILETGFYSTGSLEYPINPERLKTNLSDFNNDTNFVNTTQLATKQDQLIAGDNIIITDNGDGTATIDASGGGGGGATNLSYTASPTNGTVNSDTGTDAIIPLADGTNAGLLSPAEKTTITNAPTGTGLVYYTAGVSAMIGNISSSRYVKTDGSSGNFNTDVRNNTVKASSLVANTSAPVNTDNLTMIAEKLLSVYNNVQMLTSYVAKTASYTITSSDMVIDLTENTATFTLPTAVGIAGRRYTVKNSGTGVLTVNTTSSQTIDGMTTMSFNTQYAGMTVVSDGANWKIISNF